MCKIQILLIKSEQIILFCRVPFLLELFRILT